MLFRNRYTSSTKLSTELTRVSAFLDVPEFIFFGEFFEWLFMNLRSIELDERIRAQLNDQIVSLINELETAYPPFEEKFKLNLFDKLVKLRSDATKNQLKYLTKQKRPSLEDFLK
ncbi:hypothetical protein BROC_01330 [Candidatus Brocadiaceae bacterium]|nr:hypothetical protein BROC_01330 [Candidatus Brocadiaceae bacterium]